MKRLELQHERVFNDSIFAGKYAVRHRKMGEQFGRRIARKLQFRGQYEGRLLDVGCGDGSTVIQLKKLIPALCTTGIDLSEPLLQIARDRLDASDNRSGVELHCADAQALPFADNTFNAVININMAHIVTDPVKMFTEIERVLIPGGFLFITDIRRSWLGNLEREFKSGFDRAEARELLVRSALRQGRFSWDLLWWKYEA